MGMQCILYQSPWDWAGGILKPCGLAAARFIVQVAAVSRRLAPLQHVFSCLGSAQLA